MGNIAVYPALWGKRQGTGNLSTIRVAHCTPLGHCINAAVQALIHIMRQFMSYSDLVNVRW